MAQSELSCGLDFFNVPDVSACLSEALQNKYKFVAVPVIHPRFRRHHSIGSTVVPGFTRSDILLAPQDWSVRVVGKLSPYLDVDAPSLVARQRSEDCMNEELAYCRGLGLPAITFPIRSTETTNLARIIHSYYSSSHNTSQIWVQVPMMAEQLSSDADDNEEAWSAPWQWWSLFHERLEWERRVGVALEMSADLPPEHILKRWLGEPVKCILISTAVFHSNKKGYPVLSRAHQAVFQQLVEHEAQVLVTGARRSQLHHYTQYLHHLWERRATLHDPMLSYARGWEDFLQTPLQPLADNLDSHTYNVFEKDPVKYDQYQKAVKHALLELQNRDLEGNNNITNKPVKVLEEIPVQNDPNTDPSNENSTNCTEVIENTRNLHLNDSAIDNVNKEDGKVAGDNGSVEYVNKEPYIVMVLGAGRGPLVRAVLNAADITKSNVEVIAVEKNPCAVVALMAQVREVWRARRVTVHAGDMRTIVLPRQAHIIVSELLGSWGDNELSPECLDGAAGLLRPGGISIPCWYTSYAVPVTSPSLWAAARQVQSPGGMINFTKNMETLWVVYMQKKYDIAETKPVFTFKHPAEGARDHEGNEIKNYRGLPKTDNRRCTELTWEVEQDSVMHGFGGYFDCGLYGGETISIVPSSHSPGMISWFPVFIPIKSPIRVQKGDVISATFWRCVSERCVWYEWVVRVGDKITSLHNCHGRSSEMLL